MMELKQVESAHVSELKDGEATVVISVDRVLKADQRQDFAAIVKRAFPGRRVFIADGGIRVSEAGRSEQLERIEAKLDALIEALAEESDSEEQFDLDGNPLQSRQRAEHESLG